MRTITGPGSRRSRSLGVAALLVLVVAACSTGSASSAPSAAPASPEASVTGSAPAVSLDGTSWRL